MTEVHGFWSQESCWSSWTDHVSKHRAILFVILHNSFFSEHSWGWGGSIDLDKYRYWFLSSDANRLGRKPMSFVSKQAVNLRAGLFCVSFFLPHTQGQHLTFFFLPNLIFPCKSQDFTSVIIKCRCCAELKSICQLNDTCRKLIRLLQLFRWLIKTTTPVLAHISICSKDWALFIDKRKNLRLLLFEMYDWFNRQLKLQSEEMNWFFLRSDSQSGNFFLIKKEGVTFWIYSPSP